MDLGQDGLRRAVHNLLFNCAGCKTGDTVLIVHEVERDGYYEPELAGAVGEVARELGLDPQSYVAPFNRQVAEPDERLTALMSAADCTVFFARIGDQLRFRETGTKTTRVISYALDREMLASSFGGTPYQAFERLKEAINAALSGAENIQVTCPAGTDFKGRAGVDLNAGGDVTCKRFPLSVFTPVPATGFAGRIAQRGFLTGTGSQYYTPYSREIRETLYAHFEGNRLVGFDGSDEDVAAARAHYEFVGKTYDIDTFFVHSWHVGIHPGCHYPQPAGQNFERWSGGAFGNPRLLHFHTCGAYAPGEISLNVLDPTVRVDGVPLWENGRLQPELLPEGAAILECVPEMRKLFDAPSPAAGQGAGDRLRFT